MHNQSWYNIIFSPERSYRRKRHLFFWLSVFIYHFVRISMMLPISGWSSFFSILELAIFWGVIMNMVFSYTVTYFLVPRYFRKRKYFHFAIGFLVFYILLVLVLSLHARLLTGQPVIKAIGYLKAAAYLDRASVIRSFGNPPLICGLLLSLKTLKNWYLEQLKTETLAKENANAELQLLKAQVHPHFLFNTLNNIYSFSLDKSPQAGVLVNKLSGMLRYMINECEEKLVPLEKELKLIEDYMGLEKVRYGKRLNMEVDIHGDFENKMIAPLLMIPFIENSFKHGTSQMLRQPWIKMEIATIGNQLFFKLSNSKPSVAISSKQNQGIGLINVKKRLQLLYPGKHQLDIQSTEDGFIVNMQLLLEENELVNDKIEVTDKAIAYA